MNFFFDSNKRLVTLVLKVKTNSEQEIRIVVEDPTRVKTVYTDRVQVVNGEQTFDVRMPQSPKSALVHVFNTAHGSGTDTYKISNGKLVKTNDAPSDPFFTVISVKEEKLKQYKRCYDQHNRDVKEAFKLIQEFSERAGWISAGPSLEHDLNCGSMYRSEGRGKFAIRYVDTIIDWNRFTEDGSANPNYGRELPTPARINWDTGIMEVSKKFFTEYTIPERVIILLHEFSHKYRAKDIRNEKEADVNGALIYLAEGYPDIELFKAFYTVFGNVDTPQNRDRQLNLEKFVEDFYKLVYKKCA